MLFKRFPGEAAEIYANAELRPINIQSRSLRLLICKSTVNSTSGQEHTVEKEIYKHDRISGLFMLDYCEK